MSPNEKLDLELVRLGLDSALAHIDNAVAVMADGVVPSILVPLARLEIVKTRSAVDAMLARSISTGGNQ